MYIYNKQIHVIYITSKKQAHTHANFFYNLISCYI